MIFADAACATFSLTLSSSLPRTSGGKTSFSQNMSQFSVNRDLNWPHSDGINIVRTLQGLAFDFSFWFFGICWPPTLQKM